MPVRHTCLAYMQGPLNAAAKKANCTPAPGKGAAGIGTLCMQTCMAKNHTCNADDMKMA